MLKYELLLKPNIQVKTNKALYINLTIAHCRDKTVLKPLSSTFGKR